MMMQDMDPDADAKMPTANTAEMAKLEDAASEVFRLVLL